MLTRSIFSIGPRKETPMPEKNLYASPNGDMESQPTRFTQSSTPEGSQESPEAAASDRSLKLAEARVTLKQALLDLARTGRLSRLARKRARLQAKTSKSSTRNRAK